MTHNRRKSSLGSAGRSSNQKQKPSPGASTNPGPTSTSAPKQKIWEYLKPASMDESPPSSSSSSLTCNNGTKGADPLPKWGKLIVPRNTREMTLRRYLRKPNTTDEEVFTPMSRMYHFHYQPVFQDPYYRAPGLGVAANYWRGNARSGIMIMQRKRSGGGMGSSDGAFSEEQETEVADDEEGDSNGGGGGGRADEASKACGSTHQKNFRVIAGWVLESGLLGPSDAKVIQSILHELSDLAQDLFLKVYHSSTGCYRVDLVQAAQKGGLSSTKSAVEELEKAGLVIDMASQTTIVADLYNFLPRLHMDELSRIISDVDKSKLRTFNGRAKRQDLAQALDNHIDNYLKLPTLGLAGPGLRQLGNAITKELGRGRRTDQFVLLKLSTSVSKLIHRVFTLFFVVSGYEPEDARMLLTTDLGAMTFLSSTPATTMGASSPTNSPHSLLRHHMKLFDYLVTAMDLLDYATSGGDADIAYQCLHAVSNVLLPCDTTTSSTSTATATSMELTQNEDSNDAIVIIPTPHSFTEPMDLNHHSHSLFPDPSHRGPQDLPHALFKMAARCLSRGINLLERDRRYSDAIHYGHLLLDASKGRPTSARGVWWSRLVMQYCNADRKVEALRKCEEALEDPCVDGEYRLFLQKKCTDLSKPNNYRWKKPVFDLVLEAEVVVLEMEGLKKRGDPGGNGEGVEARVLDQLLREMDEKEGKEGRWKGRHAENGVYLTLFSLLCWHLLKGSQEEPSADSTSSSTNHHQHFQTTYQDSPQDLHLRTFLQGPRSVIAERCFAAIAAGQAPSILEEAYGKWMGRVCVGLDWSTYSLQDLLCIARGLGPKGLGSICRTLAGDYPLWRHGLPDLILWRVPDDDEDPVGTAKVRVVEVKGPGDSLSWAQRAWINVLLHGGVQVQVARVVEGKGRRDSGSSSNGGEKEPPLPFDD